ncbi:hypothetical protein NQZ68_019042 [Dissostichus eleginoides]|nr:hypothetical protein NQZ68_019042 [Dissostichus eleginoides]
MRVAVSPKGPSVLSSPPGGADPSSHHQFVCPLASSLLRGERSVSPPTPPSFCHCHLFPFPYPQTRPSFFILRASTPFLTHQPPSSPCSYPTALPSRSIPRPVHTEAYCVGRETAEGSIQSEKRRTGMCRAEMNSVFLLYLDTDL